MMDWDAGVAGTARGAHQPISTFFSPVIAGYSSIITHYFSSQIGKQRDDVEIFTNCHLSCCIQLYFVCPGALSLSQQGVLVSFGHPNPQNSPFRTPKIFRGKILKTSISNIYLDFFHLNTIPMTLFTDITLHFTK